jgi:hypothetical protein
MSLSKMRIKELLDENRSHDCAGIGKNNICVRIAAIADLPSRFGKFQVVAFYNIRDGKEHGQALAYMEDGTMVVVSDARHLIGKTVTVLVASVLQTQSGKMIFAKIG